MAKKEKIPNNPVFVDSEVMPEHYGSTSITLLARDPHWVHAYWEIAPSSIDALREEFGDTVDHCAHVLRIYDTTLIEFNGSNANHFFDIDIQRDACNWYVNLWSDHITCCADIGLRAPDGQFFTLARSNFVTTPREHFSPRNEVVWMEVQPEEQGVKPYVNVRRDLKAHDRDSATGFKSRRFRIYLTEDDIRAYYSRLFPLLSKILARRKKLKSEGKGLDPESEGELLLECLESMDLLGYDYFKESTLGASEKAQLHRRPLENLLTGGASEQMVSAWSASEQKKPTKDFFFELGTELIVYGRTEPDAVVFWGDRMIPLREDGTFTLRMALSTDTQIPLDFKAVSYHKQEQRSIVTGANRDKTEYSN